MNIKDILNKVVKENDTLALDSNAGNNTDNEMNQAQTVKSADLTKTTKEPNNDELMIPVEPRTELEKRLVSICERVINNGRKLGIKDNFFRIGINSILMVDIITNIEQEIGVQISFREFIMQNDIEDLAQLMLKNSDEINFDEKTENKTAQEPTTVNIYEPYPLTEVQVAYLLGRDEAFELGGTSTHAYTELVTELNITKLNQSLQQVIDRHPVLRTVITSEGKQKLLESTPQYVINYTDISGLGEQQREEEILKIRDEMSHYVFDPSQWPLIDIRAFKLSDTKNYLFIGYDLLIGDGMSMRIMGRELIHYYHNPKEELPPIDYTYQQYIYDYTEFKKSETYLKDKNFWLEKLEEFPTSPQLNYKNTISDIKKPHYRRLRYEFDKKGWTELKEVANANEVTPSALLCTVFSEVLAFWSNQNHHALNVTVFNRHNFNPDVMKIVGDFTSCMLLDINLEGVSAFWERVKYIQGVLFEALEHRHYDGIELIREIAKKRNQPTKAMMPIVFTSMIFDQREETKDDEGELGEVITSVSQTSQVYLDYQVSDANGTLTITWDYIEDLFDRDFMEHMFDHYIGKLNLILKGKEATKYELTDQDKICWKNYNLSELTQKAGTLDSLFMEQVELHPNHIAVEYHEQKITYGELNNKSNQVAAFLIDHGIRRNDRVAVLAKRCPETIVNIMGILKSGASYVPLEEDYPDDRKEYIYENSNCKYKLDEHSYESAGISQYSTDTVARYSQLKDSAYIIYTSGTTGRPKGVEISHEAAVNTILDINERYAVTEKDKFLAISSMCFDLSVYDIFGSLLSGGVLVQIDDHRDMGELNRAVVESQITIWNSVPAIIDIYLDYVGENTVQSDLRLVLLSGDWIPLKLPEKIGKLGAATIVSLGGATEASIWSIYYPIEEIKSDWVSIPYGYPLRNQRIYVLNHEADLCPVGVQGEIYIGGIGLAKGYVNDEEKTKEAFLEHESLGRIYKTGDYGILTEKGYVKFLGRKDKQVKINGYRVEIGEIEKVLEEIPEIADTLVNDMEDSKKMKCLIAYYVSDETLSDSYMISSISTKLPEYMIPKYYVKIDKIPYTSNGKVDKTALAPVEIVQVENESLPETEIGKTLGRLWCKMMNLPSVDVNSSFYELGGHSILMIQMISRISEIFGKRIAIKDFINNNTIRKLEVYLETFNSTAGFEILSEVKDEEHLYEPFPLTNIQLAYLFGRDSSMELGGTSTHFYEEIEIELELGRLNKGLQELINRHEMLRTVIHSDGTQQILQELPEYKIEVEDLSQCSEGEQERYILGKRNEMSHNIIEPSQWPLFNIFAFKLSEEKHYLFIEFDQLICDGMSIQILNQELMDYYNNPDIKFEPLEFTFRDYILSYVKYKESGDYRNDKMYWLNKVDNFPESPKLPMKVEPYSVKNPHFGRFVKNFGKDGLLRLRETAKKYKASPSVILCTLYADTLGCWSNSGNFALNLTMFNRYPFHGDVERIIGDFTSVMLLDIDFNHVINFKDKVERVQDVLLDALDHRSYDGVEFIRELSKKRNIGNKAYAPVVFTSMIFDEQQLNNEITNIGDSKLVLTQTTQVYLDHQAVSQNGSLVLSWDYVEDIFDQSMTESMFHSYIQAVESLLYENDDNPVVIDYSIADFVEN